MKLNFLTKGLDQPDFVARAVATVSIAAAAIMLSLLFWRLSEFLPIVFATIVIAVAWRGAAESFGARFGIPTGLSILTVALALVVGVVVTLMAFGGQLVRQYDEVALDVPAAIELIQRHVEEHPWGRFVEKFVLDVDYSKAAAPIAQHVGAALGSLGNAFAMTLFAIIGAAYLAADPKGHAERVVALTPAQHREKVSRFLQRSGGSLRQWLILQLYVIVMNAFFAGVALWAFGVPAPLALATISGALAFIPYFGSIIALVVGALVALPHGVDSAALAALSIGAASFVEGYLITPFLQSRSLSVPAVVLLFCMLAFGALFGAMGVVLAVPATVVLSVAYEVFAETQKA
ncbi:AI-2E family transporter [Methylocystis sp. WRRC1]|uniref:AI-2E family transporter n=1 Tax=Methylocystis sp. WRRC1 TaxID=1732014 RepID=UPI001D14C145|nr:AI-2E family transporter [Methylocystis sp. WRRC1]MCC3245049.1 AI-2E family transporter [Methylocystis sp. WRRC1]